MKRKIKLLGMLSIASIAAPIATVISCGSSNNTAKPKANNSQHTQTNNTTEGNVPTGDTTNVGTVNTTPASAINANNNPFVYHSGSTSSSNALNANEAMVKSSISDSALHRSAHWSEGRNDDQRTSAGESGVIAERKETGVPVHPAFTWNDLWNWNPIANANGSITENEDVKKKLDYKYGDNAASYNGFKPQIDNIWGLPDKKFNRASVRNVQPREFGEQMLPSQSTLAPYWDSRTYNNLGAHTGFVPGVNNGTQWVFQGSGFTYQTAHVQWTHSDQWTIWEALWPSADYIDYAHRNGVAVLGMGWLMTGYTRPEWMNVITAPGPNNDFPIAKGMAELANYIGFDGWWLDWEGHPGNIGEFSRALMSYCKTDQYTTRDGRVVKLAEENKKAREMYHYGPKEQIIDQYAGGTGIFEGEGDHHMIYQNHGEGSYNASHRQMGENLQYDKYWASSANNADEDMKPGSMAGHWDYYAENDVYYSGPNEYKRKNSQHHLPMSKADLTHRNNYGYWFHNFSSDMVKDTLDLYNSYTGDPRVAPNDSENMSTGNLFREKTPIVGRKAFASNFGIGKGQHLNLWGSRDILNNTQGVNAEGWKHQGMQDILPTYHWLLDFYNGSQRLNDPDNPTYTADGRVQRPATLAYNNSTSNAWYGGSVLQVQGDLPQGQTMEAKLYASRTKLKAGDKISFKVQNNWENEQERILPKLAVWTADQEIETNQFWPSDGSIVDIPEEGGQMRLGWDNTATKPWSYTPDLLKYQKATIDKVGEDHKHKTIINSEDATVTKINDNWLDVTYTIPQGLEDQTMIDFGFAIDSKGNNTIDKVALGQISYHPVDEEKVGISDITDITTDGVFQRSKAQSARISWKTVDADNREIESARIRQYLVFYLNEQGQKESLAWIGANSTAYLDLIQRSKVSQKVEIVAVDESYNVIFSKKAEISLAEQKANE